MATTAEAGTEAVEARWDRKVGAGAGPTVHDVVDDNSAAISSACEQADRRNAGCPCYGPQRRAYSRDRQVLVHGGAHG